MAKLKRVRRWLSERVPGGNARAKPPTGNMPQPPPAVVPSQYSHPDNGTSTILPMSIQEQSTTSELVAPETHATKEDTQQRDVGSVDGADIMAESRSVAQKGPLSRQQPQTGESDIKDTIYGPKSVTDEPAVSSGALEAEVVNEAISDSRHVVESAPQPEMPSDLGSGTDLQGLEAVGSASGTVNQAAGAERNQSEEMSVSSQSADSPQTKLAQARSKLLNSEILYDPFLGDTDVDTEDEKTSRVHRRKSSAHGPYIFKSSPTDPVSPEASGSTGAREGDVIPLREVLNPPAHIPLGPSLVPPKKKSPSATTSELQRSIFPKRATCDMSLIFRNFLIEEPLLEESNQVHSICWFHEKAYVELEKFVQKTLTKLMKLHKGFENHDIYMRHGSCRVIGKRHEATYEVLDDRLVIAEVAIQKICGFISDYPFEPFHLEIFWEYSSICKEPEGSQTFRSNIKDEIHRKIVTNYKKQDYVARTDVNQLCRRVNINKVIIEECNSGMLRLSRHQMQDFMNDVVVRASRLFLACIEANSKLEFLKHLLDCGFEDLKLPTKSHNCARSSCSWELRDLLKVQHGFFAWHIENDQLFHKIPDEAVLPMDYAQRNHDNEEIELGHGASANVYAIKINPVHHYLSGDRKVQFALKVFKEEAKSLTKAFQAESDMLTDLARYPHDHIVPHITSWVQNNKFNILYPKATRNLRDFLEKERPAGQEPSFLVWILKQFRGLADAVRQIHQLGGEAEPEGRYVAPYFLRREKKDLLPSTPKSGYHHDIKPENVLLFEGSPGSELCMKISDFGSGKFDTLQVGIHSAMVSSPKSTETYIGPEAVKYKKASRPFDLWALACVFTEVMVWLFLEPWIDQEGNFSTERAKESWVDGRSGFDYFWSMKRVGAADEFIINPAVESRLNKIHDSCCEKNESFRKVIIVIRELFEPEPGKRMKAPALFSALDIIVQSAKNEFNIEDDEDGGLESGSRSPGTRLRQSRLATAIPRSPALSKRSSRVLLDDQDLDFGDDSPDSSDHEPQVSNSVHNSDESTSKGKATIKHEEIQDLVRQSSTSFEDETGVEESPEAVKQALRDDVNRLSRNFAG